jgi:hypothetical protein
VARHRPLRGRSGGAPIYVGSALSRVPPFLPEGVRGPRAIRTWSATTGADLRQPASSTGTGWDLSVGWATSIRRDIRFLRRRTYSFVSLLSHVISCERPCE